MTLFFLPQETRVLDHNRGVWWGKEVSCRGDREVHQDPSDGPVEWRWEGRHPSSARFTLVLGVSCVLQPLGHHVSLRLFVLGV